MRNGPITLSSANILLPNGTKAFDIVITLTTPFLYDPRAGNLLVDYQSLGNLTGGNRFDCVFSVADSVSLIDAFGAKSLTGSSSTTGFVTQFTYTPPASVPEPTTLILFGLGLTAVMGRHSQIEPKISN